MVTKPKQWLIEKNTFYKWLIIPIHFVYYTIILLGQFRPATIHVTTIHYYSDISSFIIQIPKCHL